MNTHRAFYKFQISLKAYTWGLINIFILIATGKLIKYILNEYRILEIMQPYNGGKILLISGGPSLYENINLIRNYDYIAINSYQSIKKLDKSIQEEILTKTIIYYQAPYHKPLDKNKFNDDVTKIVNALPKKSLKISSIDSTIENHIKHIPKSYLHWYGFLTFRQTGFLSLLHMLTHMNFIQIDLLGVDMNYSAVDLSQLNVEKKPLSEILSIESEVFYEIERSLKKYTKKNIKITNLNENSLVEIF